MALATVWRTGSGAVKQTDYREANKDVEQANLMPPGDVVTYQHVVQRVVAVSHDGLWAPYFDLDEDDMVSYILVEDAAPTTTHPF